MILTVVYVLQAHPGGLLFTKFGRNQAAMIDFAFMVKFSFLSRKSDVLLFVIFLVPTPVKISSMHSRSYLWYMVR